MEPPGDWRTSAKRFARRQARAIGSIAAISTSTPAVVLTYDDGPEPGGTDAVLAALAAAEAHATFFVLLSRARLYPKLLGEVVAAGHEIALHGLDHRRLTGLSPSQVRNRSLGARAELEDRTGRSVRWVRPPYGAQTPLTWAILRATGLHPVLWGPSSADGQPLSREERIARVRESSAAGAIVLCHDGFADRRDGVDDGPAPTFDRGDLASGLIEMWDLLGLRAESLGRLLASGGKVLREARFRR